METKSYTVTDPEDFARRISAVLAVDKGVPSDTFKSGDVWVVQTDVIRYELKAEKP